MELQTNEERASKQTCQKPFQMTPNGQRVKRKPSSISHTSGGDEVKKDEHKHIPGSLQHPASITEQAGASALRTQRSSAGAQHHSGKEAEQCAAGLAES